MTAHLLASATRHDARPLSVATLVAEATAPLETRLGELLDAEAAHWRTEDSARAYPVELLRDFVARGRRVRPVLCYWAYRTLGGDPHDPRIVDMCAAIELFHSFVLIHDDIVDGAATRRGAATVHRAAEAEHRAKGWRGDPKHFGRSMALLVGDLALVLADRLMRAAPGALLQSYDRMRLELCAAECFEVIATAAQTYDVATSAWISRAKSGDYTGGWPLYAGATLAGGGAETAAALRAFGCTVGEVFQLYDDLAGAFGREGETGKSVTADIADGKPTMLLSVAAQSSKGLLHAAMASFPATPGESDVALVRDILRGSGAERYVRERIAGLAQAADTQLAASGLPDEAQDTLRALTRAAVDGSEWGR